jgi:fructose-bisphosphate aldolase, class II
MPLVPTEQIIKQASAAGRGVGAFNVVTLVHAEAIVAGGEAAAQPLILQISQNCVRFHGALQPIARAAAEAADASTVPVGLHLDHVEDDGLLREAAGTGFGSVMYDASRLPYEDNVQATRGAARWAHGHGLWLEAELGEIGGKDGAHHPGARTDPGQARAYADQTGVDMLAVAVGSSHAMTEQTAALDHELISQLRESVSVPLVLHGSSGVPDSELQRAVRHGIVKVNIGTALNASFTKAVEEFLAGDSRTVDPRRYLTRARDAMAVTVAHLLGVLTAPASLTVTLPGRFARPGARAPWLRAQAYGPAGKRPVVCSGGERVAREPRGRVWPACRTWRRGAVPA